MSYSNNIPNGVIVSPYARDILEIPKIPFMDYIFKNLRAKMPILRGQIWLEAVDCGENIKFEDVENLTKRYASALTRLGFKKGDILYYCTYNVNHLYLLRFAVWYLGGITKGWHPGENKESHMKSLNATPPKVVVLDKDTGIELCEALNELNMTPLILSFGEFKGALPVEKLLEDDGTGLPEKIEIDPVKDIVYFISTSGSTGPPKTIPHTSYTLIATIQHFSYIFGNKIFQYGINSGISSNYLSSSSLMYGKTLLRTAHFKKELFIPWLLKHKPDTISIYTFLANWFARNIKDMNIDLGFLKTIVIAASVLDSETVNILKQVLPYTNIVQYYGMSENIALTCTYLNNRYPKICKFEGGEFATSGVLVPYVQAKIVDPDNGRILGKYERGEIYVRTPQNFIGYLKPGTFTVMEDTFDSDGWFRTCDVGFYDEEYNFYIIDRASFIFKFRGGLISPSEIESCLGKHEAVLSCAVVPIPDKDNDNLARGYVVLRPDKKGAITEHDLVDYVAKQLNEYKHLHGGVKFINKIPENKNGKIDRLALKKIALSEK